LSAFIKNPLTYLLNYPDFNNQNYDTFPENRISDVEVNEKHMVSSTCWISVLPSFIGANYYEFPGNNESISDIPFGYKTNHFTLSPKGELSSSLQFIYTTEWLNVYHVKLLSLNKVIVSEIDTLSGSKVLFHQTNDSSIDASDGLYGPGNNGRDCVTKSDHYEENVVDCFYQNDKKEYITRDYLQGKVRTTGIARYVNKFKYKFVNDPSGNIYVHLTPIIDADYEFYIDTKEVSCPDVLTKTPSPGGCSYSFSYNGSGNVMFGNSSLSFSFSQAFDSRPFGTYILSVDNKSCLIVTCEKTNEVTQIKFSTPNFRVVSADDRNVLGDLELFSDLNKTITTVDSIQKTLAQTNDQIQNIAIALSLLDFNVTSNFSFKDFGDMRREFDAMLAVLNRTEGDRKDKINFDDCNSVFGSVKCFFTDLLVNLITIGIVILVCVAIYFVIFKLKLYKKCCGK
jgi:hypothetical protein